MNSRVGFHSCRVELDDIVSGENYLYFERIEGNNNELYGLNSLNVKYSYIIKSYQSVHNEYHEHLRIPFPFDFPSPSLLMENDIYDIYENLDNCTCV